MLRVGVDFDNTIVNYDGVFHQTAMELGWLSGEVGQSKSDVKQYFISQDLEPKWTELQGVVYGETIKHAVPYDHVFESLLMLKKRGMQLFLVSHKTQFPIIGEKRDFHKAARDWLDTHVMTELFDATYFCQQKELKLATISKLNVDWFIDDLPSILENPQFPAHTSPILFDPEKLHEVAFTTASCWTEIPKLIEV